MMNKTAILQVDSSGRYTGSITRKLSNRLVEQLQNQSDIERVIKRDLATGLPFVDEQWKLNARVLMAI